MHPTDQLRAFALFVNNSGEVTPSRTPVQLPSNARVYYILMLTIAEGGPGTGGVCYLKLQDSIINAGDAFPVEADLPGLLWPASAYFEVDPGAQGLLRMFYGECLQ